MRLLFAIFLPFHFAVHSIFYYQQAFGRSALFHIVGNPNRVDPRGFMGRVCFVAVQNRPKDKGAPGVRVNS